MIRLYVFSTNVYKILTKCCKTTKYRQFYLIHDFSLGNICFKRFYVFFKNLESFVWECLRLATDHKLISIAFPALGTGQLHFPKEFVADLILKKTEEFANRNPQTPVKAVEIVVYPLDTSTVQVHFLNRRILWQPIKHW